MGDPLEAMTGDRLRTDPGDPHRQVGVRTDRGRTTVADAETGETGVEDRDVEASDVEIAPGGGLRAGGTVAQPDDMVESKKDAERMHEPIHGKHPVDWAHCSGPHWPLAGTVPIEESARLRRRIR